MTGEIIIGFACHYLPKFLFTDCDTNICTPELCTPGTGSLLLAHLLFPPTLSLLQERFTSYVLKCNSDPIAPFLSFLYAAYVVWKTEFSAK